MTQKAEFQLRHGWFQIFHPSRKPPGRRRVAPSQSWTNASWPGVPPAPTSSVGSGRHGAEPFYRPCGRQPGHTGPGRKHRSMALSSICDRSLPRTSTAIPAMPPKAPKEGAAACQKRASSREHSSGRSASTVAPRGAGIQNYYC